jgi:acyl-CoA thioesterase-1
MWRGFGRLAAGFFAAAVFAVLAVVPGEAAALRLVVLGDSLTAGYGLGADEALPARLEARLRMEGYDVEVVNAGVSGDTASSGLARLDWVVPEGTRAVIVALGANDALRGIDPAVTEKALDAILECLVARGIAAMLAGMKAPPNMGADYVERFDAIYPTLARRHGVPLYPFLLDGVAARPDLNQGDGMHPTARGVEVIAERMLPAVRAFLDALAR